MKIYLDNAATTKADSRVIKAMLPYLSEKYGNASSQYILGRETKKELERSRKLILDYINAGKEDKLIFTSGGTESNNLALKGLFFSNPDKNNIITTKTEHSSIMNACKWLEKQGAKVIYLNVDKDGFIDLKELENSITNKTLLVSIMHANNEIGTIQNLKEIGTLCKEKKVLFHTDACQSFTKVSLDVKKYNLDLVTLNSHKIHGPKGVGALYIREGIKIIPLLHGGNQENGLRSGTENISGIVGFAEAVKVSSIKDIERMEKLRNYIVDEILKIGNTRLNGPKKRLCNNINISFKNIEGEALLGYLENKGIYVSTGSACQSNSLNSSHVLKAINLTDAEANSSIRISISKYTTLKEIKYFLNELKIIVNKLRRISALK